MHGGKTGDGSESLPPPGERPKRSVFACKKSTGRGCYGLDRAQAAGLLRRMNLKLIRQIGRTQRLDILTTLKRRGPMTVRELAEAFGMSYMGIKGHCLEMAKEGYLDTRRRPSRVGRPEMLYRLTAKALEVFPGGHNELTIQVLEAVQQVYGPAAPTKILYGIFAQRTEEYRRKLAGSTLEERGAALAKLREAEGHLAEFGWVEPDESDERHLVDRPTWCIVEHHSPLEDLLRKFPVVARLEREMFERVLGTAVRREEEARPGDYQCMFLLGN